jgi:hypothetical protein
MRLRASLPVVVLLVTLMPAVPSESASATTSTARSMLFKLSAKAERGSTTYSRTYFKHWIDANSDCQATRAEVLIAESRVSPKYTTTGRCTVSTGKWYSYYDGAYWTKASDVDIDHMVPLKEAWESGALAWSVNNRTRYANDVGYYATLIAVTDNVNQAKGDRDPAAWLPPRTASRCTYAIQWVAVKYRWRLTVDPAERTRLSSILSGSCGARTTTVPARAL